MNRWVVFTGIILLVLGFTLSIYSQPIEGLYFAPSETANNPYFPVGVVFSILGFLLLAIGIFYSNSHEN